MRVVVVAFFFGNESKRIWCQRRQRKTNLAKISPKSFFFFFFFNVAQYYSIYLACVYIIVSKGVVPGLVSHWRVAAAAVCWPLLAPTTRCFRFFRGRCKISRGRSRSHRHSVKPLKGSIGTLMEIIDDIGVGFLYSSKGYTLFPFFFFFFRKTKILVWMACTIRFGSWDSLE